jgi:hypothetical protein
MIYKRFGASPLPLVPALISETREKEIEKWANIRRPNIPESSGTLGRKGKVMEKGRGEKVERGFLRGGG